MTSLPIVLVHGFMGGSDQWELQRECFAEKRPFISPDLPGFGLNSHLEAPDTIEGFASYVLKELKRQGVDRFDLLGHSMGGMIVQEMTVLEPDCIQKLVLYGTAATGNLPNRFETFGTSRERIFVDGVKLSARRICATWFLECEKADQFENCATIAESSSLQGLLAGLSAMETWSRTDNLVNVPCPTLMIWGEKDRTYAWEQIDELWKTIPNSSLSVLAGCSHAAHLEKPRLFNMILDDFLSGASRH